MTSTPAIQRLRSMADNEQPRRAACDLVGELEDIRDWADALTSLADALADVDEAVGAWADEDDREAKSDAREMAVDALATMRDYHDDLLALPPLPEGVTG